MAKRKIISVSKPPALAAQADQLLGDLRQMIEDARLRIAETANSVLTMLHWHVGSRIRRDVLNETRAEYGEEILPTLSAELIPRYGRGFRADFRCIARAAALTPPTPPSHGGESRWRQVFFPPLAKGG